MNATTVSSSAGAIAPDVLIVIAAAIAATLGRGACVVAVRTIRPAPRSIEMYGQPWSIEGRREIYSSHRFR